MRHSIVFFISILGSQLAFSIGYNPQYNDYRFFGVRGHSGVHIYTGEALKEVLSSGYGAVEVKYGWQSSNPDGWQSYYLYPAYGFGWYTGFIGNPDLLGTPGAFFGFISFPLFHHQRHQMYVEPALGLSYDLKPYDEEHNNLNDAIGSRFNVYFNLTLGASYRLNREIDLMYGVDLTHFSNGRTFRPNKGLNMFGVNVGFRYHFNVRQNQVDNSLIPEKILNVRPAPEHFRKAEPVNTGRFQIYVSGGQVQNIEDMGTSKQHFTHTAWLEYQYLLNTKNGFAAGIDFFYDSSLKTSATNENYHFWGAHLGYDFMFWNLSIRMQAGSYLHEKGHRLKGNFFFRPALKYDINQRFFTQLGLKTQAGFKADWVELGIGLVLW